jgi:hypothetical protein
LVVNAFLDSGSDTTLIDSSLTTRLGLEGVSKSLTINTVNGKSTMQASLVAFNLVSPDGQEVIPVRRAWSVNALPKLKPTSQSTLNLPAWSHLKEVPLPSMEDREVMILIGADVPKAHWVLEQRRGGPEDPYAVKGPLGWVILGPVSLQRHAMPSINVNHITEKDEIHERLERMFNFEFVEASCTRKAMSEDDKKALRHMTAAMRLIDGHYEIPLPWKPGSPCLPDNKGLVMRRLMALKKRLEGDGSFRSRYTQAMNEYVANGYAELVPEEQQNLTGRNVWYLPHHGVYKHGDATKVRVVFDCAAACGQTSLNLQLFTGPDLVNSLCGVLLRFREHQYTLVADIEAMFHQVKVPIAERDSLRFLWWPAGDLSCKPKVYRMTSHPFGATSSPSCASLALQQTIESHMAEHGSRMLKLAQKAFYVDDCLMSLPSIEEIGHMGKTLRMVLSRGGFNLTKFFSNVKEAIVDLPQAETKVVYLDQQSLETKRTLGVEWESHSDSFVFNVAKWEGKPTRRELLSLVASL